MQWSEFGPYVHPFVIGCPEPVMIHHARLATIEWCRKTQCWVDWLDDLRTDGITNQIEIDPSANRLANKVKTVMVGGQKWGLKDAEYGIALSQHETQDRFCYTDDGKVLHVYPLQPAGLPVRIRASLTPTIKASAFDDALLDHLPDIAEGAIASIQRLPKQAFTDPADSAVHEANFRNRIKTIAAKVSRGFLSAHIAGSARFY